MTGVGFLGLKHRCLGYTQYGTIKFKNSYGYSYYMFPSYNNCSYSSSKLVTDEEIELQIMRIIIITKIEYYNKKHEGGKQTQEKILKTAFLETVRTCFVNGTK